MFNTSFGELKGVTAIDANNVWAVGYIYDDNSGTRPLAMRWNGSAWSIATLPGNLTHCCYLGETGPGLSAVSATSANDVWAVGNFSGKNLTLHFDGTKWSEVSSPNDLQKQVNYLTGVAAVSTNDVWAVGVSYTETLNSAGSPIYSEVTTSMHWNGSAWSLVSSPDPSSNHNFLRGVTKVNGNDVWAVGNTADFYNVARTMIQHYVSP